MSKFVIAAGVMFGVSPAFAAEYYIVQDAQTKQCSVMEGRPAPGTASVLGAAYVDKAEAESRMKTIRLCNDTTTGSAGSTEPR
jgi:hypothetical protein